MKMKKAGPEPIARESTSTPVLADKSILSIFQDLKFPYYEGTVVCQTNMESYYFAEHIMRLLPEARNTLKTILQNICFTGLFCLLNFPAVTAGASDNFLTEKAVQTERLDKTSQTDNSTKKELEYQTLDELFALYQPYLRNISAYEPIYFLVGTSPEKSKFQFSFKYRPFSPEGRFVKRWTWLNDLYLAYTQTSFWDLTSASRPFEDTSYKPELFYRSSNLAPDKWKSWHLFLQTGIQHESNGRGGTLSRGTNYFYLKPVLITFKKKGVKGLQIAPRIWIYVHNEDENNPDLKDYRGYFDLEVKAGKADGLVAESHLRYASEGASWQLDLTYPLHHFLGGSPDIYLQAQYVTSLAESLLDYRERTEILRLGISIVR